MADEPDNMILKLLREVRSAQDDHGERLRHIETQIDEMRESMIMGLGLAAHANVRHDRVEQRLVDLTERVEKLERRT